MYPAYFIGGVEMIGAVSPLTIALSAVPVTILAGQPATVMVAVTNTGASAYTFKVNMTVTVADQAVLNRSDQVTLTAGASTSLSWSFTVPVGTSGAGQAIANLLSTDGLTILGTTGLLNFTVAPGNIFLGCPAILRSQQIGAGTTYILNAALAAVPGTAVIIQMWPLSALSGVSVAIFRKTAVNVFQAMNRQLINSVPANGLMAYITSLAVAAGDYIGIYYASGVLAASLPGTGGYWYATTTGDKTVAGSYYFALSPLPVDISLCGLG